MDIDNQDIIDKLWELKYIGSFPLGIIVLLVPLDTALKEINYSFRLNLTPGVFKRILKDEDIHVFSSIEDWVKYKTPEKTKRRLEGILVA